MHVFHSIKCNIRIFLVNLSKPAIPAKTNHTFTCIEYPDELLLNKDLK